MNNLAYSICVIFVGIFIVFAVTHAVPKLINDIEILRANNEK